MTALQSMVGNLTLPYRRGAYVNDIELGYRTDNGVTPIPEYGLDDYAARHGVAIWDVVPAYLVAPRFDVGEEYVCLSFDVQGWPEDDPLPQVRIPARTPAGTTFIIPLGESVNGMRRLTRLREWPEPPPEASPGRERWQLMALIGNLGRLLWTIGWERAYLGAVGRDAGSQRQLATAHGYSLDLIGRELRVPRLFPSAYPVDPATIALYHLDRVPDDVYGQARVGDRVIDETGRYHGQNEGAERGVAERFNRAFRFRSGDLPRPRCAAEHEFQQRLRSGDWDWEAGERSVRFGPYRRYGYREGAIEVPGPDGEPHGVWVNDEEAEDPAARGQVTSACYGFVPDDLGSTIERFGAQGRTIQQAIDYYGEWWGQPEDWFVATYEAHGIEAPRERCVFVESPLTYVRIPNRSAFDIPADQSFTVEAFVRPVPTQDIRPRVIAIKSHEIFYGGVLPAHCVEGWALSMGPFNCIQNNIAWSVSDLPETDEAEHHGRIVTLTADMDLGDGRWHHVAGVIDRRYQVARLYVDGVQRGCRDVSSIGEIANQEDILLGVNDYHFDAPYDGLIDEVRLSNVARRSFHPALGESDERYRTRLSIYKPWLIPTYDNIRAGLRRLLRASPYGPEAPSPSLPSLDVEERDGTRVCTERLLTIRPLSFPPGAHIDLKGDRQKSEQAACGPRDEQFFEWQLITHANEAVEYAMPNARRMQLATARSLDNLVRLLEPQRQETGNRLRVLGAYEPGSDDLRAVGRALHLHMEELPASVLAAFAHKACFDYVEHLAGEVVRAAVREERDNLEILTEEEAEAERWPSRDAIVRAEVGDQLRLTVGRPSVPDQRYFDWLLLECGPGRGELREVEGDNTSRLFVPTAPGRLIVKVEYPWQGAVVAGRREIRIGLRSLPPCERIGGDGALGVDEEEAAGSPGGFFHEALLVEHNDPVRVDYGDEPDDHRLQIGAEKALDRLLALIEEEEPEVEGRLRILRGYYPAADDLASVGRNLMLAHEDEENMPLGRLAALAHDAGFAWVYHPPYPDGIFVATGPESPLEILPGPIQDLAPNAVVNWLGIMRADLPEAPTAPEIADPANTHEDPNPTDPPRVTYANPSCRLMTPETQERLNDLLDLLEADGAAGTLEILGAFDAAAANRRRAGAAVKMRHESVMLERLGALAHQAGFDYVKHVTVPGLEPATHYIYASVWQGEDLSDLTNDPEIVDYGLLDPSDSSEVPEEGVRKLCLRPDVLAWEPPPDVEPGEEGAEEQPELEEPPPYQAPLREAANYYWCLTRYGPGRGRLDSPPERACKLFTAQRAGVVGARGEFVVGDATEPYRFALVVQTSEDQAPQQVPKPVYDDLMNFLEFHHPVGVEGRALALRQRVPELTESPRLQNADTERTYPRYRQRRAVGGQAMGAGSTETSEVTCGCPPWEAEGEEEVDEHGG